MSYAEAAGSKSNENARNIPRDNGFGKYFNEKMLVCIASGFTCEDVADSSHKGVLLHAVSGLQSFDFHKRIGLEVEDDAVRNRILCKGLDIKNRNIQFFQHKRREIQKVFVSQLPLGISGQELRVAFTTYGCIESTQLVTKFYHDKSLYTGDWLIHFSVLSKQTPYYVTVRGWKAYVKYRGICDGLGCTAKDCLSKRRETDQDQPMESDSQGPSSHANSPRSEVETPVKKDEPGSDSDSLFSDLDTPKKSL